jgi:hypothetical protein
LAPSPPKWRLGSLAQEILHIGIWLLCPFPVHILLIYN